MTISERAAPVAAKSLQATLIIFGILLVLSSPASGTTRTQCSEYGGTKTCIAPDSPALAGAYNASLSLYTGCTALTVNRFGNDGWRSFTIVAPTGTGCAIEYPVPAGWQSFTACTNLPHRCGHFPVLLFADAGCSAGYDKDATALPVVCVPKEEVCPIAPLPPITDPEVQRFEANPNTSDIDRLSDRMKRSLSCLQQAIGDAGGTSSVGSAYRPPAYNQHLIDVWKKWDELREETNLSCQALRAEVWDHFKKRHKLLESQPPVPSSPHTRGEAFDLTSNLPNVTLDSLARGCGVYRNLPVRDRVHFIHR